MSHFAYRDGALHAEGVPLARIADEVGTPVYVYSTAAILGQYRALEQALAGLDATIFYAVKANANLAVIATLARAGAGADVVSEGEMRRSMAAGVPADRILFAGVGKTRDELAAALEAGIAQINVESESELELLSRVAASMGLTAPVGIRVNPDVDARTHAKITTGKKGNKFGIDIEHAPALFARARALPGISATSLSVHIGSQLNQTDPFRQAFARLREMALQLRAEGHTIDHLDCGGGLGIAYDDGPVPDLAAYAAAVRDTLGDLGCRLSFEPGRFIVGNAGVLLSRAVHIKSDESRRFVVLDAAMNDLIRPAMYDAWHDIRAEREGGAADPLPADIVGPICESSDIFARARPMPAVNAGDLVAIMSAGAYGSVMSSTYNARPLVAEVLVDGDRMAVVRVRQRMEEMWSHERLPAWMASAAE